MQNDGGGGTFITLNTVYNGVFDPSVIGLYRAERQQRVQRYGLLATAAVVQPIGREDVEVPVVKHKRVGLLPVGLCVETEDIQV